MRLGRLLLAGAASFAGASIATVSMIAAMVSGDDAPAAVASESLGINAAVLSAYLQAAARGGDAYPGCSVPWTVLAAVGRIESRHAGGRDVSLDGQVDPPVLGPLLDGSLPGTRPIPDTDGGQLDGDGAWDRAVGPMQVLPGNWRSLGQDGNDDGIRDPQNMYDAALTAAVVLCRGAGGGDLSDPAKLQTALHAYNPSGAYVEEVKGWVAYYGNFGFSGSVSAEGLYALPVDRVRLDLVRIRRPHHDYPAWDLPVPEGTTVHAVHGGTVVFADPLEDGRCGIGLTVKGDDQMRYTYCHATGLLVAQGQRVVAGQPLMLSGNTGNSTGPHLHLGIQDPTGRRLCPQPFLEAWYEGLPMAPGSETAYEGCVS
ncbi:MAG: peptidoglycan DD-metalloendopeptidase family protein [Actinomycetota bacterium]